MSVQEDVMWQAVQTSDPSYDGKFFYAVKTTGIFCRPSCKSKVPIRENVQYYPLFTMALSEGFRPCKRCRPDLLEAPSEEDIVRSALTYLQNRFSNPIPLDQLAMEVGMSKYHLQRTFKKVVGLTPMEYVTKLRIDKALSLLKDADLSITEIGHEVGYQSSSYFSELFHRQIGCTPMDYRRQFRKGE